VNKTTCQMRGIIDERGGKFSEKFVEDVI